MTEKLLMTRPWPSIEAHFRELNDPARTAIADLCAFIEARRIRTGLYGWTSLWTLCVVQKPAAYPHDGPYLSIEPLQDGTVEFRYVDTFNKAKQWSRVEKPDGVIHRFRNTMKQLSWFTDPASLDD